MAVTPELLANLSSHPSDRIALRHHISQMTYFELTLRVDQLASHLRQLGVKPGGTVAICLERSFEWIIASLSAMRAGAAYVPLDLAWPAERLRYIIADSRASVLISSAEMLEHLRLNVTGVDQCRDAAIIAAAPTFEPPDIAGESLAYVIYTSGTTGLPKGVEITHGNLYHLIKWHCQAFAVTEADRST